MKTETNNKEKRVHRKDFKIHQIVNLDALKRKKLQASDRFVSPVFGNKVPDKIVIPGKRGELGDRSKRFDAFREKPLVSVKDEEDKYGRKYYEFDNVISNDAIETYLGGKPLENEKVQEVIEENLQSKSIEPIGFKSLDETNPFLSKPVPKPAYDSEPILEQESNHVDLEPVIETFKRDEEVIITKPFNYEPEEVKPEPKPKPVVTERTQAPKQKYVYPPLDLFKRYERLEEEKPQWLLDQIDKIDKTLKDFGIDGKVVGSTKGPTVTRYEVSLSPGINVNRISSIHQNLMMNLSVKSLRILSPIPGKPYVGLEFPNDEPEMVGFRNVAEDEAFLNSHDAPLKVALGVDIEGENIFVDIAKMPHGLVAGATNSGKSVSINTILVSLLFKNSPEDLRLILIDPKIVELNTYNDIPHLITPVITDAKMASEGLKWAVNEMEKRYVLFADNRSRDIKTFNENVKKGRIDAEHMPYIVIVIDELADLMMVSAQDVEDSIRRITQKARAAGIHLIVATQRPTTDVIKGTIKSNIPTRIAFKVASHVDSLTILDSTGAEELLGQGDMLLKEVDSPTRLQGAYISDDEIYSVTDYIIANNAPVQYILDHNELTYRATQRGAEKDELFEKVAQYIVENNNASVNNLQGIFNISFNRASAIVKMLADYGVVERVTGTKARKVLIELHELEEILNQDD